MQRRKNESENTSDNRKKLSFREATPEMWHAISDWLNPADLASASRSCLFFRDALSNPMRNLRAARQPRDYSRLLPEDACHAINPIFRKNAELHHLTLLNSNTIAVVAYKHLHIIQFTPSEAGSYTFTPYREIPLDDMKVDSIHMKLIQLPNNKMVIANKKTVCIYNWMTGCCLLRYETDNSICRLASIPDGYMILTCSTFDVFQLSYYDQDGHAKQRFHLAYQGVIHRISVDSAGHFLLEGSPYRSSSHHDLHCYTPDGRLIFKQEFIHDNPRSHLVCPDAQNRQPGMFIFINDLVDHGTVRKTAAIYEHKAYPALLAKFPVACDSVLDGIFLQNERFFVWQEDADIEQLNILDLETKKIIHRFSMPGQYMTDMISFPNGDILSIVLNRDTFQFQLRAFCFPPRLALCDEMQARITHDIEYATTSSLDTESSISTNCLIS